MSHIKACYFFFRFALEQPGQDEQLLLPQPQPPLLPLDLRQIATPITAPTITTATQMIIISRSPITSPYAVLSSFSLFLLNQIIPAVATAITTAHIATGQMNSPTV